MRSIPLFACISALGALFLLGVHLILPSEYNGYISPLSQMPNRGLIDGVLTTSVVEYRESHPVFSLRLGTTGPILFFSSLFSLSKGAAFVVVETLFSWAVFFLFLLLSFTYHHKRIKEVVYSFFFFLTSFTILFSHFAPNFAYDEWLQFGAIWSSFFFINKKKWISAASSLAVALIARETTILLFPSLFFLFCTWPKTFTIRALFIHIKKEKMLQTLFLALIGYVLYLQAIFILFPGLGAANAAYLEVERFAHFAYNTQSLAFGVEGLVTFFLVYAFPLYLVCRYQNHSSQRWKAAFWLATLLNVSMSFLFARVQEARIMALPLVFLWPSAGTYLRLFFSDLKNLFAIKSIYTLITHLSISLLFLFVSLYALWFLYVPTHDISFHMGYQVYGSIVALLISLHLIAYKQNV